MKQLNQNEAVEIVINGDHFFIKNEGDGIGIYRNSLNSDRNMAYLDCFYTSREQLDEEGGISDPVGPLAGNLQLLVYDLPAVDAVARCVWHSGDCVVSVADGQVKRTNGEVIFVSDN